MNKTDLKKAPPEEVARDFLSDYPIVTTTGYGCANDLWLWTGTTYDPASQAGFDSLLTRWLDERYRNLQRLPMRHIGKLICSMRYIGHDNRQWLCEPRGIAYGWQADDLCVAPNAILNVKLAAQGRPVSECAIRPTPNFFATFLDSRQPLHRDALDQFLKGLASSPRFPYLRARLSA